MTCFCLLRALSFKNVQELLLNGQGLLDGNVVNTKLYDSRARDLFSVNLKADRANLYTRSRAGTKTKAYA